MIDNAALRRSQTLEAQADVAALQGLFGQASALMKEANRIRAAEFGRGLDPNQLRDLTDARLRDSNHEKG